MRIKVEDFLQFLQGKNVFIFLKTTACRFQKLIEVYGANGIQNLRIEHVDFRAQVAFRFQLTSDFGSEIQIPGIESFSGSLQTRFNFSGIEDLNHFSAESFLQAIGIFPDIRKTMERLFGQRFMNHLADCGWNQVVDF